ncbi:hypothetical protein BAUCODRAFT_45916, partial [Baudoinia panamericana UAMH 10762]
NTSGSSTSSCRRDGSTRHCKRYRGRERRYATIAGDHGSDHHDQHPPSQHSEQAWPTPLNGQQHPTPYQIFAMRSTGEYSKARFYEMVKVYHPDLSNGSCNVAHHIKMERYRLIVAAHTILSDPVKRSAYDRFGAGWNGKAEVTEAGGGAHPGPGPFTHSWGDHSDPIWANATWEDWERFYARRAQEQGGAEPDPKTRVPQAPVYMQNSFFLALVVMLAIAGSSANYGRAQDAGTYFVEQRDLMHDRAAKELRKVRQELGGVKGRQERIDWFVRQREATLGTMVDADVEALREEKANRILPDREVCQSEGISE